MSEVLKNEVDVVDNKETIISEIESVLGVRFSEDQLSAIEHFGRPLNILSCAGSGKTTTLIGKMLFMEMYYGVPAKKILAITFNREAIDEMEERYMKARRRLGLSKREKITFKTYHSLYHLILKSNHSEHSWKHLSDYKKYTFKLNDAIRKNFKKWEDDTLETIMSLRGYQVNNLLSNEELLKTPKFIISRLDPDGYLEVVKRYEELKKADDGIDFDDLQTMMYQEMQTNEKLVDIIRSAWDYIVVDEYQDISKVQLAILKKMVTDPNRLTAIGDDDQSIYEFRGSKTEYIVDFSIHFPGAERIVMGTNYRVPENILLPVTHSIENNKKRVSKEMTAARKGGDLVFNMVSGSVESAQIVADEIEKMYNEGTTLSDIMILIRNNNQQRLIVDTLLEKNIPVSTRSEYRMTNHFILSDIKNIIELAIDETNATMFNKMFSKITKYVKKSLITETTDKMKMSGGSWRDTLLRLDNPSIHEASSMLYTVNEMVKKDVHFDEIVEVIQKLYRNHLLFLMNRFEYDPQEFGDLLGYIKKIGSGKTYEKFYKDAKRKDSLMKYFSDSGDDAVQISTMHRMKGMEYPIVFLLDLTEKVLPDVSIEEKIREAHGEKEAMDYVEQERRLFYVAWTRAKERLHVIVHSKNPSRFIVEAIQSARAK